MTAATVTYTARDVAWTKLRGRWHEVRLVRRLDGGVWWVDVLPGGSVDGMHALPEADLRTARP